MNKSLKTCAFLLLLLLYNQAQGQHTNQLEIKLSGGVAATEENHTFSSKGFPVTQKAQREGRFFAASFGTNELLKVAETSYSLRSLAFDETQLHYTSPGADISSPRQQLSMLQQYLGATYYPLSNHNSRIAPFLYTGLGFNVLKISQEQSNATVTTPAQGDVLPTVVTWVIPSETGTFGMIGYEAAIGMKYLDSEKFGAFIQLRYNMVHQNRTNMVATNMHMIQVESGLIWRTLKKRELYK